MSAATLPERPSESPKEPEKSYLQDGTTLRSWLLTTDHKRIAILYLLSISFFFAVGTIGATLVRIELTSPTGVFLTNSQYNRMFSMHGIVMVFLFLIPSIPTTFGNFLIPLMLGARDLAFPKLNLASWYVFNLGGLFVMLAILTGGIDTGWTFYTPYSSLYSNSSVTLAVVGIFIGGMSNIMTGINFVVTIHSLRAPGMTWFRMPLFVWSMYATSVIQILATPVVAITLVLVVVERVFRVGFFSPELGGDPVLFEHFFWFYSHPAVYIMVLPAMGVVSELMATFCQKRVFGYAYVAMASLAIAFFGFLVWGHHMFISSQSTASSYVFSLFSFLIAIPSAIKVFNWAGTMHKAQIRLDTPLLYAIGFIGLFTIGGLTGLYLATLGTDVNFTNTYFVVAHFHYVMVGGTMSVYLGRDALLVAKDDGADVPRVLGENQRGGHLPRLQPHLLPPVRPRFPRDAPPLPQLRVRAPVAGPERPLLGGRDRPRRRLRPAAGLPPVVAPLRQARPREPLARHNPGVDRPLAAADPQLRRPAHHRPRSLRLHRDGRA